MEIFNLFSNLFTIKGYNYMKKIIILSFISLSFSQYFGGNIQIGGAFPRGELMEQEVPNAFALDANLKYYLNDYAAIGLNFGGSQYGFSRRDIPFNQWTNVGLIEETRNNMSYGNLLLKIIPFKGPVKIFGEGLVGIKNLNTTTKLFSQNNNCDNPDTDVDECEIASTTDATDSAFGYGAGGGIEVYLTEFSNEEKSDTSILSLIVSAKYLWGGDVQYLKEGGITVTPDPDGIDFPTVAYEWNQSKTDVLHFNVGLQLIIK